MIRIGLDSNILAYLAGVSRHPDDAAKVIAIEQLIRSLKSVAALFVPSQALGELFIVLRRAGASAEDARSILLEFSKSFEVAPSNGDMALAAANLVVNHKLQYWDALILTAGAEAGCSILLSEDMQHGFVALGLTVVNPLVFPLHSKLTALFDQPA